MVYLQARDRLAIRREFTIVGVLHTHFFIFVTKKTKNGEEKTNSAQYYRGFTSRDVLEIVSM